MSTLNKTRDIMTGKSGPFTITFGKVIGYCRVSNDEQKNENQEKAIYEYGGKIGLKINDVIKETVSSRSKDRKIYSIIEGLKEGDTLVVYELSRLARSMRELNQLVNDILKAGAELRVINNDIVFSKGSKNVTGECMLFAFGMAAQIERDMISERTMIALKARKAQGVKLGRPKGDSKLKDKAEQIAELKELGLSNVKIAKRLQVSRGTVLRFLDHAGIKKDTKDKS